MFNTKPHDDAVAWMTGDYSFEAILHTAIVTEHLGAISEMRMQFEVPKRIGPGDILGKTLRAHVELKEGIGRSFSGLCTAVETRIDGTTTFVDAEVRPWLWMLTRNQNTRIFQDKTVKEIIEQVFSDAGFSDHKIETTRSFDKRTYCVQYRESDFDFISRLMEQEGIYYFFPSEKNAQDAKEMIICDDASGHKPVPEYPEIEYCLSDSIGASSDDQIRDWSMVQSVVGGKVTLDDFNFLRPTSDLTAVSLQPQGDHTNNELELYDHPGKQTIDGMAAGAESSRGDHLARVRMEAEVVRYETWRGRTGVRMMGAGRKFGLKNYPVAEANTDYIVTSAYHQIEADYGRHFQKMNPDRAVYTCDFTAIAADVPYRSMPITNWPVIPGLHTAKVVGPSGEEIYTDEYGRIKVQFHWDRKGENDENSSCWVRVVTPWSGMNWGMIHIPRIGQEVVIQFEEGDPDRPICTGMLYNEDTKPPYPLPDNKTVSGIRTDSSKDASDTTHFNELKFDDLAGEELVRMQAQKHHEKLVKNKSSLTIGFDELDYGDHDGDFSLSTVIKQNVSEKITDGDKFLKIETGSETIDIKKDKTQTIEGKRTETITGNDTTTIKQGDYSMTLDMGNHDTQLKMGDVDLKVDLGSITHEAMQSIELKVGSNSIKIDQTGVTIKGLMIKIEGEAMAEMKSPMTTVKGDAMLVLKGGVTMIN